MGRLLLIVRLAARDLLRRPAEAALLLLAIAAATTTLTVGLTIHGVASDPYANTREVTAGPDVVATILPDPEGGADPDPAALESIAAADGVTDHSGPFPVAGAALELGERTMDVQAIGRDAEPADVDRPAVTDGDWVRDGGIVVEAAFAEAAGLHVGDPVTLAGREFEVAGIAVTAALVPYPWTSCLVHCMLGEAPEGMRPADGALHDPGTVWLTVADVEEIASAPLSYVMNLKLADPDDAQAFVLAHGEERPGLPNLLSWNHTLEQVTHLERNTQRLLTTGGTLLGILAVASVAVLVGGRMADQTQRVGLLKAAGATPGLVAAVLLAASVTVALLASAVGLVAGRLTAPLFTERAPGLLGAAGEPALTASAVAIVTAVALGVAVVATLVPAVRAARTSTVAALNDAARPPRRIGWLIALSTRLPPALLIALRLAGRRPRRVVLSVASVTVTVSGVVAAMAANAQLAGQPLVDADTETQRLSDVLLVITVMLIALAAVNAVVVTWATVLDARHASAVTRALGATPAQLSAGLSLAQMLPAFAGALLGVGGGLALYTAIDPDEVPMPSTWSLVVLVPGVVIAVAALTAIPALLAARRPVAPSLQAELA
ncbi:FtsX-like permease family protein [Jiangella muralis]|uniref:FtsX-like permease family protein n=1 Tax=Jiangella muralis TaxID=702383 RepID=UPI00069D32DB|nr:FtsX-like permease family protein [Jiangella muralis]